ncbi:MAG: PA2779 family protein [Amphritea sp.]
MKTVYLKSVIGKLLICLVILFNVQAISVNAAMIPTESVIQTDTQQYSKSDLIQAMESAELKQQLLDMGINPEVLEDRVASLTPDEISQLNAQLETQPAGEGFVGLLALIFVVFVITDAMCATDLFSFVHCVNR